MIVVGDPTLQTKEVNVVEGLATPPKVAREDILFLWQPNSQRKEDG